MRPAQRQQQQRREIVRMVERVSSRVVDPGRRRPGRPGGGAHVATEARAAAAAAAVLVLAGPQTPGGTPEALVVRDVGLDSAGGGWVVGSHPSLVDDAVAHSTVSRRHARVVRDGRRLCIEDLNSTNGTCVNGARLEPFQLQEIAPGDTVHLGTLALSVRQP